MPPRRIRIIEDRPVTLADRLEPRAREVVADAASGRWDADPLDSVTRQLGLALEELDRARLVHQGLLKSALHNECEMRTELIQMEARTPRYSPYRYPERDKIQRRLFQLDQERRRLLAGHELRMAELRQKLLALLERQGQIE